MSDGGTPSTKPEGQQSPADSEHTDALRTIFYCGLMLVLVYILGIGPADWIHHKYPATQQTIEAVYAPLDAAYQAWPPAARALDWYLHALWRVPPDD